jgi:outer membrane lipoprotein-sorting protein
MFAKRNQKRLRELIPRIGLFILILVGTAMAQTPEQRGLEIAIEADRIDSGFGDLSADLVMTLRNKHGQETSRIMRTRVLEQTDDGDKSLIIFDSPGDVKGTAFLSFTHREGSDDQWLYLPALKRVKRIASSNKSGPFMGSEFAYEDIASQEVEKYDYKFIRIDTLDGRSHFVIERDPEDPKSGYTRQIVWLDDEYYRVRKIEYYDRGDKLLKTLNVSDYNQYLDKYWRADNWEMTNHQTGKSTTLSWKTYSFQNGFKDKDFNRNALSKAR